MYSASLEIDNDIIDAIIKNAGNLPKLMETAVKRQESRIKSRLLKQLRTEPGSPKYPIQWSSDRQRKAYFASNGFGGGIPYQRTGKLVRAWKVEFVHSDGGLAIVAENPVASARYVIGDAQQPFHKITGWYNADNVIADETVRAQDVLIETWYTVTDSLAGVGG